MSIDDQKKKLRKIMLTERLNLDPLAKKTYDQWVCGVLWHKISTQGYKHVHCYLPMGTEIDIVPLIKKMLEHDIVVVTPKTLPKRQLQNLRLLSLDQLEKGVFGTSHPAGGHVYEGPFDLIIVPGLAFTADRYRLGYGGGYYDNFLVDHPEAKKIGIFYPFQMQKTIPLEPHDVRLNEVLVNEDIL